MVFLIAPEQSNYLCSNYITPVVFFMRIFAWQSFLQTYFIFRPQKRDKQVTRWGYYVLLQPFGLLNSKNAISLPDFSWGDSFMLWRVVLNLVTPPLSPPLHHHTSTHPYLSPSPNTPSVHPPRLSGLDSIASSPPYQQYTNWVLPSRPTIHQLGTTKANCSPDVSRLCFESPAVANLLVPKKVTSLCLN